MPIRILFAGQKDVLPDSFVTSINDSPDILSQGTINNIGELASSHDELPDIVICPLKSFISDVTPAFRSERPVRYLAFTTGAPGDIFRLFGSGLHGLLSHDAGPEELRFAVRAIAAEKQYLSTPLALTALQPGSDARSLNAQQLQITHREMDVLKLMVEGFTNAEMANKLFTSVRTIETRRKNLLSKTGTTNTATLIRFAVLHGLVG
jgi:DNA-binding NarL/FixJ family response regulator